ncbi:MAG: AbrB/MazE/SpoVT family DNA-binding domain-containing protein [Chloroflexi bacterium]|nr:AbrB/MazE/SpoVT family DNA-binding domain-containing protein [Chloroflexota bacterium]
MAPARITSKGQITIPKEVRDQLGVEPGDALEFHFESGHLEVRPIRRRRLAEFRGTFPVDRVLDFDQERTRARKARARRLTGDEVPTDA